MISQPFTHTFLPALLVFIERYLIDFEGTPSDMRDMTTIDWREIIFLLKKYPIPESIYPLWKECTAEFLRAGYCIHHGELDAPVLVCLSGYKFDRMDRRIFRVLDIRSESHHFG